MKITGIEMFPVTYVLARPGAPDDTYIRKAPFDSVIIRIHTDNGLHGVGEAPAHKIYLGETAPQILAALALIEDAIRGLSPWDVAVAHRRIRAVTGGVAARVPEAARAAVDMALFDLMGKDAGQPVWRLLQGGLSRSFGVFGTEYGQTLEAKRAIIDDFIARGYVGAEVKLSVLDEEITQAAVISKAEMLAELMEHVPRGFEIIADCNLRWGPAANIVAMFRSLGLERYPNLLIEQPVSYFDLSGLARVREMVSCPVVADESAMSPMMVHQLARLGAADFLCLKLPRVGGLLPGRQVIDVAEAAGMGIKTDSGVHGLIADTATVHLASCAQMVHAVSDAWTWLSPNCATGGVNIVDGRIALPEGPGLGVDLDVAEARRIAWRA